MVIIGSYLEQQFCLLDLFHILLSFSKMFKRWKKKNLIFPSHLAFSYFSSLTFPKEAKELLRQPECHEEDSSELTTPNLIKLTQVEWMCNLRNRASLSPSQGEKGKSGSPAGSSTQCHCWKAPANFTPGSPALPATAGCGGPGQELQWEEDQGELPGTWRTVGSKRLTEAHCLSSGMDCLGGSQRVFG